MEWCIKGLGSLKRHPCDETWSAYLTSATHFSPVYTCQSKMVFLPIGIRDVNPTYRVGATLVDWRFRALQRSMYCIRTGSKAEVRSVNASTKSICVVGSYFIMAWFMVSCA